MYISKELKAESLRDIFIKVGHSSIIHNSKNTEAIQMSIEGWMDKQKVVYIYNIILGSLKK